MRLAAYDNFDELEQCQSAWDRLADRCVFRTWRWLATWWRHYGSEDPRCRLHVVVARDADEQVLGVLPCYVHASAISGRTLRLLGDGEVCSDHLGLLAATDNRGQVADAIADALLSDPSWDALDFAAVDDGEPSTGLLLDRLQQRGCHVDTRPEQSCWTIDLPDSWDEFLAMQSKSHRKQLRRLDSRILQTDSAAWRHAATAEDFSIGWDVLEDLHQRRRQSLGEPGCFSWPRWRAFHEDIARQLLAAGELRLSWLELDGEPVAAEYHFARGSTVFAYQGGLSPEAADAEPGRLSLIACIQHAIGEGRRQFDLLRGDEPYKAHWRATPQAVHRVLAIPPRFAPRVRYRARTAIRNAGRWVQQAARLFS
ncbi:MAG: hypothetical protein CMJ58_18150 [Planctomycetaceae bacterium]|nr:hypothetical protein [Planctomycetaceae bacterium]